MKAINTTYTQFAKRIFILLLALVTMGVGTIFAESWKWTASSANELGTSTSFKATLNNKTWLVTRSSVQATNYNSSCIQLGKSGGPETVTLKSSDFAGTIKSISVECASYQGAHKIYISVGEVEYLSGSSTASWTNISTKKGEGDSSGQIQIKFTNGSQALYIKSIAVEYYPDGYIPEPEPDDCGWVETDINKISSNDVVVITMNNGTTYAMSNDKGTDNAPTAVKVTVSDNKLEETEITDNIKWNISNNNDILTIYPNGSTNTWLYCTNNNNGVRVGKGNAKTFTIKDGYLYEEGTTEARYVGVYESQDWRCYTSINNNIKGQTLKFYRYVDCATETTINLYPNYGTASPTVITSRAKEYNAPVCEFSHAGYAFVGWNTQANGEGSSYLEGDKIPLDGTEVNLYAQWEIITYQIKYIGLEGATHNNPTEYTIESETIIFTEPSERAGYNFVAWDPTSIEKGSIGDKTITAQWEQKSLTKYRTLCVYNIEYIDTYGVTHENPDTYTVKTLPLTFAAPTSEREGYTFKGWNPASLNEETRNDQEVTALWQVNSHTLIWNVNGGNPLTGEYTTGTVAYGRSITPPANPTRTGYTFAGWSPEVAQTMPDHDLEYTAQWTVNQYTITYHTNGGDAIPNGTYTILSSDCVLPTPNRIGYIFDGWYDNEDLTGTAITTILQGSTGNKAYWAKWDCALASATVTGTFALVLEEQFQLTATAKDSQGNTLTCPADATYTWQRKDPSTGNWVPVTDADADKTTLTYPSATVEHCGIYRCVIAYGDCQAESNIGTGDDGYKVRFFHLKGNFEGDWTKAYPFVHTAENGIAICTLPLNAGQYFEFKIYDGISEYGNGGTIDRSIADWEYGSDNQLNTPLHTGADGDYVFTLDYNALLGSGYILTLDVTYPLSKQAEGHTIYYDNLVHNWTNVYYRIGHTGHNQNSQMTLVPGTSHLYKCTTPKYDDFEAWQVANNVAWSGLGHSIYKVNTGDGYAISAATEYKKFVVVEDITLTPDQNGTFVNGENCTYYPAEKQPGMKSWNTKVIPTTGATITVSYTDVNNAKQSFTSGDRDLAHTCLLTITAVADAGYTLGTLTVNDIPFTSGNVHTLSADAIIKVTATPNTYTISFDGNGADAGSTASVSGTYLTDVTLTTNGFTRTDYTFTGWNTKADGSGTPYANGATFSISQPTNTTLYAQWKPIEFTNYRTACTGLITWNVDGVVYATTEVEFGASISTLPTNPANDAIGCCADAFVGWTASTAQVIPAESIFLTLAEAQAKYPSVAQDMTFYAVFATAAKGVGTSTVVFSEMGYANGEQVSSVTLGDGEGTGDATIAFAKAAGSSNEARYYNDGSAVRVYAGGTITVTSTYAGANITKVVLTYANNDAVGDNAITAEPTGLTDNIWSGNAQSVTFTVGGSTGHRRIASISVTTDVDGRSYTNYVTHCETLSNPTLGAATLTYANGTAIDVKCGQRSSMNSAAVLTFSEASNLTCPITLTATPGFLLSTSKNDNSKYGQSVTVKPIKSEPNKGKITQKVYVRAEAAAGLSGRMSGTITVTGSEITETTINVNAEVMCTQYTLTVVDHLGNTISTTNYYKGDEVAKIAQPTPDDCSEKYTFVDWSTTEVEYGSLVYNKVSFPFTMPAENVTLYPVYICSEDYHRVTEELGTNNWEGQYLITASDLVFANGKTSELTKASISEGFVVNNIVKATRGDLYSVLLIGVEGGYVLKTQESKTNTKPYVYITAGGTSTSTTENITTADNHPLSVTYNEPNVVIKNPANTKGDYQLRLSTNRFTFNTTGSPIYLYKKYLYTTPLICGSIEAADAVVTSTAGQTIKVNVPITLESTLGGTTNITATSDNPHFTVTPLENIPAGNHAVAVHYTPAPDATIDGTEIANITLTASHGNRATTTFQVTGRHLPENFVIAAKWGDNWYALPANMTSESITEGVLIKVDNAAAPTKALAAPNTTKYGLKSVYTSNGSADRYANNGERLVFVENVDEATPVTNKTLYNGGGDAQNSNKTSIQVYAQYTNYHTGAENQNRYEWIPTTTDLMDYTLTSAHAFASEAARTISLDKHGIFGTLLQDKSYSGMVRLLPVDNFYEPVELQVVEWKQNSISIMYTGAGTKYTTKVGNNAESGVQSLSKIDHAVYNLSTGDLTTATNQALIIAIKDEANNTLGTTTLTIPWIVSGEDAMASKFSVVSDATDIVILKGATFTAEATKYTYNNVTIYGGGKLAIPTGTGLGMNTLTMRVGAVENDTYVYAYPELVLNGEYSNTSAQINLDYLTTQDYYYPLSVPEQVTIADIKYPVDIYGSNVTPTNTGSFQLKYYDGAQRVAQGSQYGTGWVVVDESTTTTLTPNQGYAIWGIPKKVSVNGAKSERQRYGIHRIPMKIAAGTLMTNEKTNETIRITAHGDASTPPNDRGWNYLGNPYLAQLGRMDGDDTDLQMGLLVEDIVDGKWTGGWKHEGNIRYITVTNDCQNFEAIPVADATISPFTTFFVQAGTTGAIALTSPATVPPSSIAARRYAAAQEAEEITTGITLTGNGKTDRTGLLIADNFTEAYDFNADLSKFENSSINLYTIGQDGKLAYMAINQVLAEQAIPVGITAPADGEYVIAFDDDRYDASAISALYLIDYERQETTNLLHYDYTFQTAAGTNNQRFALQVAFAPANATNIEWIDDATIRAGVEGNTLLLNNLPTDAAVQVFDALGRLMYHAPTVPTELQLTLPTGYYLVRIANKQHTLVIDTLIP